MTANNSRMPGTVRTSAGIAHSKSPKASDMSMSKSPVVVGAGTTNAGVTAWADGVSEPDDADDPEPPLDPKPPRGSVPIGPAGAADDGSVDRVGAGVAPGSRVGAGVVDGRTDGVATGSGSTDGSGPMDGTGGNV